jgi:hypothetical protein
LGCGVWADPCARHVLFWYVVGLALNWRVVKIAAGAALRVCPKKLARQIHPAAAIARRRWGVSGLALGRSRSGDWGSSPLPQSFASSGGSPRSKPATDPDGPPTSPLSALTQPTAAGGSALAASNTGRTARRSERLREGTAAPVSRSATPQSQTRHTPTPACYRSCGMDLSRQFLGTNPQRGPGRDLHNPPVQSQANNIPEQNMPRAWICPHSTTQLHSLRPRFLQNPTTNMCEGKLHYPPPT